MAKNLMPEVARMLGVELNEEFKIKGYDKLTYKFNNDGLIFNRDNNDVKIFDIPANALTLVSLLNGESEIVKLPWKPRKDDVFYSFYSTYVSCHGDDCIWKVKSRYWNNNLADFALYKAGWVFKTRAEAEAALPAVAAEMGLEYEL